MTVSSITTPTHQALLIDALMSRACYPHLVTTVERIETHISYVLLAGDYVYKIKKAVNFGFLDFSTLEKRKHCCEEELRLNRRQAADLYLAVIPITGTPAAPQLNGTGKAFEYAVKMRRFSQQSLLDQRLAAHQVTPTHIDLLAQTLVDFHHTIAKTDSSSPYGGLDKIIGYTRENCRVVSPLLTHPTDQKQLAAYCAWIDQQHTALGEYFARRKRDGFIRECHGDLHVRNITLDSNTDSHTCGNVIHFFDCIEFNPALRWVDVVSELAFLAMDLDACGHSEFSRRLLNRYFEFTGDYAGVTLLRYYLAYRAMVRAKVALLRLPQANSTHEQTALKQQCSDYVHLASRYATQRAPALILTHGLSGSGKSTHTTRLVELLGAIRLRSDVERKRLFSLTATTSAQTRVDNGIYTHDATQRTYAHLAEQATLILKAGFPVIIDATSIKRWQRDLFRELAHTQGSPFVLVDFDVDVAELERRIRQRQANANDASDATLEVLHQQLLTQDPLTENEHADVFRFSATSLDGDAEWQPLLLRLASTTLTTSANSHT